MARKYEKVKTLLPEFERFILISDRKDGNDFRGRIVSGEAKPAEHNGHIWSRKGSHQSARFDGKRMRSGGSELS